MTTILAVVGDTHINSSVGLSPLTINLDDGGTYRASKAQRWLWYNWLDYWECVAKLVTQHDAKVWTVFNGDLVEGDGKNRSHQLITQNDTTVMSMALDAIQPALEASDRLFVVRGTAAHVGLSASLEEKVAIDIEAVKCKETDTYSWWKLLLDCDGVLFDITHHGKVGRLPWTKSNPLNVTATRLIMHYAGYRLPKVAIRSHNHIYVDTFNNYPIRVIANPAWQLKTEYSHRLDIIEEADIGGSIFICDGGNLYEPIIKQYKPERQRPWRETDRE